MNTVKKYIDDLFSKLPNNKRANMLKTEMLLSIEKRYQKLLEKDIEINQIEEQLIEEIDTAEEIRKKINSDSKKQSLVIFIEIFIFTITLGISIYLNWNEHRFISDYNMMPRIVSAFITTPILFFLGSILTLTIIEYMIKPQYIFIHSRRIRLVLLIISIILIGLYLLVILNIMGYIFNTTKYSYLIYEKINIIAVVTGLFYYLGGKKV